MFNKLIYIILAIIFVIIIFLWLKKNLADNSTQPEHSWTVQDDEGRIICISPDKIKKEIGLQELEKIQIETNDRGPIEPDVFWILTSPNATCRFPQGAIGEKKLSQKLLSLPNFDYSSFESAMLSAENRVFEVWKK